MKLIAGTMVAERFRLIRELGAGGMGAVWLAQHMGLGIPCAVKFILGDPSPELRARFEREARAAAQLRSPNVVQVLDSGICEGTPYIAMEYLEGEDLAHRIKRLGRMSLGDTAFIIGQVARALSKAHGAGLVHRDLKPENIFIVRDEEREIAKVLDFGIAKESNSLDGSSTKTGALLGTPYYMSPEQARGVKAVDHRADLWSIAVVAFQCVTGTLPFMSDALGDLLVQIIINPIPMPSQVASGVPQSFDAWWARAAQRDPALRYQSAKDLADGLSVACGVTPPPGLGMSAPGAQQVPSLPGIAAPSGYGAPSYPQNPSYPSHPSQQQGYSGQPQQPYGLPTTTPQPMGMHTRSGAQASPAQTTGGVITAAAAMGERPRSGGGAAIAIVISSVVFLGLIGGGAMLFLRTRVAPPTAPSAAAAGPSPIPPTPAADPTPSAPEPAASAAEPATSTSGSAPAASATEAHPIAPPVRGPLGPKPPKGPQKGSKDFGF